MKISYYYEEMPGLYATDNDDISGLIRMHVDSFTCFGWEAVRVSDSDARKHPLYDLFDDPTTIFATSKNPWRYTRACYMRWLAYAVAGHPFADFDVINYGFTPRRAKWQRWWRKPPTFLSHACAAGLLEGEEYGVITDAFLDFQKAPHALDVDVNDMNILFQTRSEWFRKKADAREYTLPGWRTAKLVHYPYHYTSIPRTDCIRKARPFGVAHGVSATT